MRGGAAPPSKFYRKVKGKLRQIYMEEVKPIGEVAIHHRHEGARLALLKPEVARRFSDDKEMNALLLALPDEEPRDGAG